MMIKGHCQQLYNLVGYPGQGGSIHHNSPQHEEYMAPEDLQQVTLLCFACKSQVTAPECAPE